MVHHGGAGTTAAAARAGVPQVVVPHFGDQFYWGHRVHRTGLGPAPVRRTKLNVERLSAALQEALSSEDMRIKAQAEGRRLRSTDGLRLAVEVIESGVSMSLAP